MPALDDTFVVMTYGSRSGTFDATNLPPLTGLAWRLTVGAKAVTLTVVR